jgi:hypothetical protein
VRRFLAVNVAANWAALTTTIIVGFLLTPFMLHRLGDAAFGLWVDVVRVSDVFDTWIHHREVPLGIMAPH